MSAVGRAHALGFRHVAGLELVNEVGEVNLCSTYSHCSHAERRRGAGEVQKVEAVVEVVIALRKLWSRRSTLSKERVTRCVQVWSFHVELVKQTAVNTNGRQ
jgi:hypothetical protein